MERVEISKYGSVAARERENGRRIKICREELRGVRIKGKMTI